MTTQTTLGRRVALTAIYLERYGLSLVFFVLAGLRLHGLIVPDATERAQIEAAPVGEVLSRVIWVQLYIYVGLLLLIGRRVTVPPQKIEDLVLPLGTTFFYIAYNAVSWLPACLTKSLLPAGWHTPGVVAGFALNLLGLGISGWAALHLGRSFSVWIEVRKVVLEGAYRHIRHPMYLGYLCFLAGLVLANFSWAYLILVPIHMFLLLYRARREENRLAESSPEYAAYRKRTGFIFPKFRTDD